eukprot:2438353-Amphidinium_carterae.2
MPATPVCDDSCDRKHGNGNSPESRKSKSIPIALGLSQPGDPRCAQHALGALDWFWPAAWCLCPDPSGRAAEIGMVDHPPVAVLLHHMTDNMRTYRRRSNTRATQVGPTVRVGQARVKVPAGPTRPRLARPSSLVS